MQIHEITLPVNEGVGDWAKSAVRGVTDKFKGPAAQAATAAEKLTARGYGAGYQGTPADWKAKLRTIAENPATKQYINSVVQAWKKQGQQLVQQAATAPAPTPATAPATTPAVDVSTVKAAPKGGAPTPQEQEKFQQRLAAAAAQQPVKEAVANPDAYKRAFLDFINHQMATRETTTGHQIGLDDARKLAPDLAERLDLILDQIVANAGTPEELTALQNYVTHALAGVQAAAQDIRNKTAQRGLGTTASRRNQLNANVEQLDKLNKLSQSLGGLDNVLQAAERGAGL